MLMQENILLCILISIILRACIFGTREVLSIAVVLLSLRQVSFGTVNP